MDGHGSSIPLRKQKVRKPLEYREKDGREHKEMLSDEDAKSVPCETDASEDIFSIESIEIEEMAIDGICGVY